MPRLVVGHRFVVSRSHSKNTSNRELSTVNPKLAGFSLIEIALSLFVILAIITIVLTTSATYNTSRKSNLQGVAGKIATRQIETLRNTDYDSVSSGTFNDTELAKLPNPSAAQTVSTYSGDANVKQVLIQIDWQEGGINKSLKMDTLIYRNGL